MTNGLLADKRPAIVDVGANGAEAVLTSFGRMAPAFARRGRQVGVLVIVAADESAYSSAEKLLGLAKPWAAAQFIVANEYRGAIDGPRLDDLARGANVMHLASFNLPKAARPMVEPLGFALIGQLDEEKLAERLSDRRRNPNHMMAANVADILANFRLDAIRAVRPAAEWLIA